MRFSDGIKKIAVSGEAVYKGARIGGLLGTIAAVVSARKFVEGTLLDKSQHKDAKSMFEKMRKVLPEGTVLLTHSDMNKRIKSSKTVAEMQGWQQLRNATEGNAAALPASFTKGILFELGQKMPLAPQISPDIVGKNVILTADKVPPAVLAHEAGHIIDYDEEERGGFSKKLQNALSLPFRAERAAWDKAPDVGVDPDVVAKARKGALGTYYKSLLYPLGGAGLGAAAAALLTRGKIN